MVLFKITISRITYVFVDSLHPRFSSLRICFFSVHPLSFREESHASGGPIASAVRLFQVAVHPNEVDSASQTWGGIYAPGEIFSFRPRSGRALRRRLQQQAWRRRRHHQHQGQALFRAAPEIRQRRRGREGRHRHTYWPGAGRRGSPRRAAHRRHNARGENRRRSNHDGSSASRNHRGELRAACSSATSASCTPCPNSQPACATPTRCSTHASARSRSRPSAQSGSSS